MGFSIAAVQEMAHVAVLQLPWTRQKVPEAMFTVSSASSFMIAVLSYFV
jgi:hypothetical protein